MTVRERKRFRGKSEGGRERAKKTDGLLDRTGGRRGIIERARKRDTTKVLNRKGGREKE